MLFTVSTSAFSFLRPEDGAGLVPFKSIFACFSNPTIMLFIGGFVLAIGLTKVKLDVALARVLLKPFGTRSEIVLLGFILVTAIFSAFVSNTATAAMMLAFLTPVLRSLPADGKGRIALALAIPVGANLGGMITPIGTPPNMIALDYLSSQGMGISFVDWTIKMAPFVIVLLILAWFLLRILFPFKQKHIKIEIEGDIRWDYKTWSVVIAFILTIFMWMFGTDLWGIDTNVVAMLPIAIFCATGILTRRDLEEINWSVLWMVAGGFALGVALNYADKGGVSLSSLIVSSVPFDRFDPLVVMILAGLICFGFSNFISHSAATSLLVPVLGVVAGGLGAALENYGGAQAMLVGIAIASSVSMILPISTPPNAIAHSTGFIQQKDMMKVGIIIGLLGLVLGYAMLIFIGF
jgi:sodium-dependent dicarboxylate transporter 2/3/5